MVIYPAAKVAEEQHDKLFWMPQVFFAIFMVAMSTALMWRVLLVWRRQMDLGKPLWFEKWSGFKLLWVVIAALVGKMVLSDLLLQGLAALPEMRLAFASSSQVVASWVLACAGYIAESLLCLWWCDRTPRTWRTLAYSAAGWMLLQQILLYSSFGADMIVRTVSRGIFQHRIDLRPIAQTIGMLGPVIGLNLAMDVAMGLVALLGYSAVTRRWRRNVAG